MSDVYESDIAHVLHLAFGRTVSTVDVPVPAARSDRMTAFALDDRHLPERVVLFRYRPNEQARALRAVTALQALHGCGFPVPALYYFGWSSHAQTMLVLTEYVEGRGDEGQPHAFFARVGPHFAQTLAALHQIGWETLPDLPVCPLRYLYDSLAREALHLDRSEFDAILGWLGPRLPGVQEQPHALLHGDYTLQNIMADHTLVCAVMNWEHAMLADARLDVGYASAALSVYGLALSDQFIEAYEAAAGAVPDREFWEVFGALRLLVQIVQHIKVLPDDELAATKSAIELAWTGLLRLVQRRSGITF